MKSRERAPVPREPDDAGDQLLADYEEARKTKLTADEISAVRDLLKRRERWDWIASSVKTWALWIAAVIGAWAVGLDGLRKALKSILGS